jgi:hypothetical protein
VPDIIVHKLKGNAKDTKTKPPVSQTTTRRLVGGLIFEYVSVNRNGKLVADRMEAL